MSSHVLITGGAGFLGSHISRELVAHGHRVRILDSLSADLDWGPEPEVELLVADVRDPDSVARALAGIDAVIHLAGTGSAGQSLYRIADAASVNSVGTAVLLEALLRHPISRLVVASDAAVYGEGVYKTRAGRAFYGAWRGAEQLRRQLWEPSDGDERLLPAPTPESKSPAPGTVYAVSKYAQEQVCLIVGRSYDVPVVALRLFHVYGPGRLPNNRYGGVVMTFASRLMEGLAPVVTEDGGQQRDFVNVSDVATAFRLALEADRAGGRVFNIGSGKPCSILGLAGRMARAFGREETRPQVTGKFRMGDVRHCFADITLAQAVLGFRPQVELDEGLSQLAAWLERQAAPSQARAEQYRTARGLEA